MKTFVLILGLTVLTSTAPAIAGGCMGGDHTHTTDSATKDKKVGT